MPKHLFLASTSTVHGKPYLEYCTDELADFLIGIKRLTFIPFARPGGISHDEYTAKASARFDKLGITTRGLHSYGDTEDMHKAIRDSEALFTGGGNTFVLVDKLYKYGLHRAIKESVEGGTRYIGTSAGTNIAGLSINTTNDMPIVYPPGFEALGLVDFDFNPHYLDPDPTSTHKGETRETRIKEFHSQSDIPVVGLREGSWLLVENGEHILKGDLPARIFEKGKDPYEINSGSEVDFGR
jgi:dipeptidase E